MKINAFCTANVSKALGVCDRVIYCGTDSIADSRVDVYGTFCEGFDGGNIYLPTLCDESLFEGACDHLIAAGAKAMVYTANDLTETGIIESRYKLSPIMLLHKYGVLDKCTIVGGVCLDNDDLDLMAQEGVPLVLTPTASAGYGYGFAPVCAAIKRGLRIGIGTFDGKYNSKCGLEYEAEFLRLTSNAEMRTENSISKERIGKIMAFE